MKNKTTQDSTEPHIQQIEYFRHGIALLPELLDKRPGVAFFVPGNDFQLTQRFCTYTLSAKRTCPHLKQLLKDFKEMHQKSGQMSFEEGFRSSIWYRLAVILGESSGGVQGTIHFRTYKSGNRHFLKVTDSGGETLLQYLSGGTDRVRFVERCTSTIPDEVIPHRGWALSRLSDITRTDNEKNMNHQGFKTRKQVLEASFWFKCAYHCYREFEEGRLPNNDCTFTPAISKKTGIFTVSCLSSDGKPLVRLFIPRNKVKNLLSTFLDHLPNQHALAIHPIPLKSIFKVTQNTELDLEIRPQIQLIQENGEESFFENKGLKKFTYGHLVYIKEMGIMAQLELSGTSRKFKAPVKMVLKKSQVPVFLEEYEDDLQNGPFMVDDTVKGLKILKNFDRLEVRPEALDRNWYWLSVEYGFGNQKISLAEILKTRKAGQRYIGTVEGWIDCASEAFQGLEDIAENIRTENHSGPGNSIRISRLDLFRLQTQNREPLEIEGRTNRPVCSKNARPQAGDTLS